MKCMALNECLHVASSGTAWPQAQGKEDCKWKSIVSIIRANLTFVSLDRLPNSTHCNRRKQRIYCSPAQQLMIAVLEAGGLNDWFLWWWTIIILFPAEFDLPCFFNPLNTQISSLSLKNNKQLTMAHYLSVFPHPQTGIIPLFVCECQQMTRTKETCVCVCVWCVVLSECLVVRFS